MDIFVVSIVKSLSIHDAIIDEIRTATTSGRTLQMVTNHCRSSLPPDVQQFAHSRIYLIVCDGLLMYGTRIVVLFSLRTKMLDAVHGTHQGIVKYRERARSSVW